MTHEEEKIGFTKIRDLAWQYVYIGVRQFEDGMWRYGIHLHSDGNEAMGAMCSPCAAPCHPKFDSKYNAVIAGIKEAKKFIEQCRWQKHTAHGVEAMIEKAYNEIQPTLFD